MAEPLRQLEGRQLVAEKNGERKVVAVVIRVAKYSEGFRAGKGN